LCLASPDIGEWLGVDGDGAHTAHEHILVTDITRRAVAAPNIFEQNTVNFSNEPQAERQFIQAFEAVIHCPHVVDYFFNVFRNSLPRRINLELQDIFERALRAFDL